MSATCPSGTISGCQFSQWLVDQQPKYDKLIIEDIRPTDGFVYHVDMGTFEAFTGTQHTRDRFNHVYPDTTQQWDEVSAAGCLGTPCDMRENTIGWGSTRLTYGLEKQSWQTPLLCFDQDMHITHAKQQFRYIISDILKPATSTILSMFLRKRGLFWADNKVVPNSTMSSFTFNWVLSGHSETYFDCSAGPTQVYKLTPQHLQRWVEPLIRVGYLGKNPWSETRPPMLELVTDTQTLWELDRLGAGGGYVNQTYTPTVSGNWRFEQWDAASKYWRYGFSGQIGNYTSRVDVEQLRFNYVGVSPLDATLSRYQVVIPYKNIPSSGAGGQSGLKSINNPDYDNAQFAISFIWHPQGIQCLVSDATPINPEMPFASRNFAGRWQFVMDNLGADANGTVISNKRRNKGQFIADFKQAVAPFHTEWLVALFHKREPSCLPQISPCNADPGYPTQTYTADPGSCPTPAASIVITPVKQTDVTPNVYAIEANTILCDQGQVLHAALTPAAAVTTLTLLAAWLNQYVSNLGTWSVSTTTIVLTSSTCAQVEIPWVVSMA